MNTATWPPFGIRTTHNRETCDCDQCVEARIAAWEDEQWAAYQRAANADRARGLAEQYLALGVNPKDLV